MCIVIVVLHNFILGVVELFLLPLPLRQWSFRKIGAMGTLALRQMVGAKQGGGRCKRKLPLRKWVSEGITPEIF